jgi:hypothetical protein
MKIRASQWLLVGTLALGVVAAPALIGCSSPTSQSTSARPPIAQLAQGLTVIDADPAVHVYAAYRAGDLAVFLETKVGPLKPQVYRDQFPNEPAYEMDSRVVDQDGRTFTLVIGGDSLIDKSWGVDMAAGEKLPPNPAARQDALFQLARTAGQAVAGLNRADISDHVFHLVNATKTVPSENVALMNRANVAMASSLAAGVQRPLDSIGYHYLEGDLYGKSIFGGIAHHSNVWGWDGNYDFTTSTWSWTNNIVACNHGDCSNSGNMSYQNESSFSGGSGHWVPAANTLAAIYSEEPSQSNSVVTSGHGCQSGYNWDTPPGHECNDDSAYELWQIHDSPTNYGYGGSSKGNGSNFCATSGSNGNACSCSSSCNSCSGDWGYPPNPG